MGVLSFTKENKIIEYTKRKVKTYHVYHVYNEDETLEYTGQIVYIFSVRVQNLNNVARVHTIHIFKGLQAVRLL